MIKTIFNSNFAYSRCVVGNLWDVTDKDMDLMTKEIISLLAIEAENGKRIVEERIQKTENESEIENILSNEDSDDDEDKKQLSIATCISILFKDHVLTPILFIA